MNALVCQWTVRAGILLGEEDKRHTRAFQITSDEWLNAADRMPLLLARSFEATAYAMALQLLAANGMEPNWVNIEFIWI